MEFQKDYSWVYHPGKDKYLSLPEIENILSKHLGDKFIEWVHFERYGHIPQSGKTPVLDSSSINNVIGDLKTLLERFPEDRWILEALSDVFVLLNDYASAVKYLPEPILKSDRKDYGNKRITLKLLANKKCTGFDYICLFDRHVTKFGFENLELVVKYFDEILFHWEKEHGQSLIEYINDNNPEIQTRSYYFFAQSSYWGELKTIQLPWYTHTPEFENIVRELTREAENTVREEKNIPRVGEGWISERNLYYEVKELFQDDEVISHARPEWLKPQHLDVFLPTYKIALEYQGKQHFEPVEYFGGEKAYEKQLKRDRRKKMLCTKNGITLIEVIEGYDIKEIQKKITILANF